MKKYEVQGKVPSCLPDGEWNLIWHDEFDEGTLDRTKWDFRYNMMGKRCKHWVGEEGIEFDNDNVIFKLVEKDGVYCSSQLQTGYNYMDGDAQAFDSLANANKESDGETVEYFSWPIGEIKEPKFMHKFGYYECRCKMQQKEGWWCAFWMQSPIIGSTMNPEFSGVEVDIMEQFAKDGTVQHINHWNGYGPQYKNSGVTQTTLEETEDGYHTFGLHWTKDFYRFYVDGKLTREINAADCPISKTEQFVLVSTESVGYRNSTWNMWDVMPDAVGDKWYVDYVRVFEEK